MPVETTIPQPAVNPKRFPFTLGADPEFNITVQNRRVDACQTLKTVLKNRPEFHWNGNDFEINNRGSVGWDNASATAEVRPRPANTPKEIVENIRGLLEPLSKYVSIFGLSPLSEHSPIGGHIHMEIPYGRNEDPCNQQRGTSTQRKLASFYLPILISENPTNLSLRIKQGYGSFQDHRIEQKFTYPDGKPGYTFEFRCPSSEWMLTPKIAESVLAYVATVYHEILTLGIKFKKYESVIFKNSEQGNALQILAVTEYGEVIKNICGKIKKYVRGFQMYPQYKDEIEYLFNHKQVLADKKKTTYDISIGWGLQQSEKITKKDIFSDKKVMKEAQKKDLDQFKELLPIFYNNDLNTSSFADKLSERVLGLNWKLKNTYCLFGMRKGIPGIIATNYDGEILAGREHIKTTSDKSAMNTTFEKMWERFTEKVGKGYSIDLNTGRPKERIRGCILIGISYELRTKREYKDFLEVVWNIEQGKQKTANEKKLDLIDDSSLPVEQKGIIAQAFSKEKTPILIAKRNTSTEDAMRGMIDEATEEGIIPSNIGMRPYTTTNEDRGLIECAREFLSAYSNTGIYMDGDGSTDRARFSRISELVDHMREDRDIYDNVGDRISYGRRLADLQMQQRS